MQEDGKKIGMKNLQKSQRKLIILVFASARKIQEAKNEGKKCKEFR